MNKEHAKKKVAIVHDFLLYPGGAERVLQSITELYPQAPIYTLLYDEQKMGEYWSKKKIRTSFLQKWPKFAIRKHRRLLPFFATAIESLDLREYDLVISSSGAWSKGLVTRLNTIHIAYIHSPMRYVWDENEKYMKQAVKKKRFFARQLLSYLRVWDYQAAQRPDVLIANSSYTADRIKKYYRLNASVIYPPVKPPEALKAQKARTKNNAKSFILLSRIVDYKNISVAVDVCNKLELPLTVVGEGPDVDTLKERAGKTVTFKGYVSEQEKWQILQNARALLFPAEEDFGIVIVEALLAGIPVIGLGRGALPEIIIEGKHGVHFAQPTVEVMADGVRRFLEIEETFESKILKERGAFYSQEQFHAALKKHIKKAIAH